jgi:hypothetical protein
MFGLFWNVQTIEIDIARFVPQFKAAVEAWTARETVVAPLCKKDFKNYSLAIMEPDYYPQVREMYKESAPLPDCKDQKCCN